MRDDLSTRGHHILSERRIMETRHLRKAPAMGKRNGNGQGRRLHACGDGCLRSRFNDRHEMATSTVQFLGGRPASQNRDASVMRARFQIASDLLVLFPHQRSLQLLGNVVGKFWGREVLQVLFGVGGPRLQGSGVSTDTNLRLGGQSKRTRIVRQVGDR